MKRVLVLLLADVIAVAVFVLLIQRGVVRLLPWAPIFFLALTGANLAALRRLRARGLESLPAVYHKPWAIIPLLILPIYFLCAAAFEASRAVAGEKRGLHLFGSVWLAMLGVFTLYLWRRTYKRRQGGGDRR